MIILDTNVISEPLRSQPHRSVITWLDAQMDETLYLTTITVAELRFGVAALPQGRRRDTLAKGIEGQLLPRFSGRILPFDEPATASYAHLRTRARNKGVALGDFDALIAAIAMVQDWPVATRDTAPFVAVGVPVIDPFQ